MSYCETAPLASLRPWIECIWTRRDGDETGQQRVLPDGCADLVFDLTAGRSMAVGTMTTALLLPPQGQSSRYLGVRFRPGRAAAFLSIPLKEITDARVPLDDLWRGWSDAILERRLPDLLSAIEGELLRRLDPERDRRVDGAVERIVASGGAARIEDIAGVIGISRQHLSRQFLHHVGVSPKVFARVVRFRGAVSAVSTGRDVDWAGVAAACGYYDQSHLIAEFRELSGVTPASFHFSHP